ncbi:MAG TPA: anthranilate synthase component I [Casimicrobium huifangae]|jgi:anthranilate synthase component 1|uniref:anthranilate synthase component I n=2 Tax=Casimicrobium huifangae TaxID=2591109 RepID=UPI0012EBD73F|nr:anthranilate synthase component I [Casimicrobium huifangae]HOB00582.1 anthranilate synthase component I [Casimicrobium huifangae]HQA34378.1 anthranilate synthase component I [Casimicrobium huifangae]HQD65569.1 anthranilate synthase component I [Casimicrobium huifangae]
MTEQEFLKLAQQGFTRIPLVEQTLADLDTPLSIYLKLANDRYTFLLESVVGGERFGRYSFIGLRTRTRIEVRGNEVTHITPLGPSKQTVADPLDYIAAFQAQFKVATVPGLPRFAGGLTGYFGFETAHFIEPRLGLFAQKHPKPDHLGVPDILLLLTEELAVVDNLSGTISLIVYADPAKPDAFQRGNERLAELRAKLREPARLPLQHATTAVNAESQMGQAAYEAAVKVCKDYIAAGDCMQVVPSQRMVMDFPEPPISLYRAMRTLNPSPYMFFYNFGDFHVVGASPEILVRKEGETVTVRPIAGTRKRGATREEDDALAEDLLSDEKEVAEHVMLIDLGRNDVGRIAKTGSVVVKDKMIIERYSHVMHIVSNVEATLKPGTNNIDVLRATFPAGTLSGAPKIRALEIIHEVEPVKRNIYGGAVGYMSYQGDMDMCIAIRTAVIQNGKLYAQAGAGIVHDSVPTKEWEETLQKVRSVLRAAEMVQRGLDGSAA